VWDHGTPIVAAGPSRRAVAGNDQSPPDAFPTLWWVLRSLGAATDRKRGLRHRCATNGTAFTGLAPARHGRARCGPGNWEVGPTRPRRRAPPVAASSPGQNARDLDVAARYIGLRTSGFEPGPTSDKNGRDARRPNTRPSRMAAPVPLIVAHRPARETPGHRSSEEKFLRGGRM